MVWRFSHKLAMGLVSDASTANAIRYIPYHTFHDHSKCGEWCGYVRNKENYDHKIIPGGFEDEQLFADLTNIFDKLADNAQKFSSGASSNSNESLNATMMSKHPKSRCYSTTVSADFRYACAKAKELKKNRTALLHRRENIEGVTYKSNCTLLTEPAIVGEDQVTYPDFITDSDENAAVLFDLETSGLDKNCDILQIAAKYGNKKFNIYIVQSFSSRTHSYTIQPTISADAKLLSPLFFLVLKEPTGKLGRQVEASLFRPDNVYIEVSKSEKLTSSVHTMLNITFHIVCVNMAVIFRSLKIWLKNVFFPNVESKSLLLIDLWTEHCPDAVKSAKLSGEKSVEKFHKTVPGQCYIAW
ncbi:hypothetical protein PV327_010897 [Microctonus hyperodae]|uniref:Uncharacterized protein n=1 Tax=Microctonus hyperodae TaxID=165561 RepID=A0AA39F0G0_MICHY|nr:hypothetical protein PV327_010897 [Microctonus hyperodae]